MEIISGSDFRLSSGREIYAFDLRFGMNKDLTLTYGYDGTLHPYTRDRGLDGVYDCDITDNTIQEYTPEEGIEIADYMIDLWQKFRAAQITP